MGHRKVVFFDEKKDREGQLQETNLCQYWANRDEPFQEGVNLCLDTFIFHPHVDVRRTAVGPLPASAPVEKNCDIFAPSLLYNYHW